MTFAAHRRQNQARCRCAILFQERAYDLLDKTRANSLMFSSSRYVGKYCIDDLLRTRVYHCFRLGCYYRHVFSLFSYKNILVSYGARLVPCSISIVFRTRVRTVKPRRRELKKKKKKKMCCYSFFFLQPSHLKHPRISLHPPLKLTTQTLLSVSLTRKSSPGSATLQPHPRPLPNLPRGTRVGCTSVSLYTSPRALGLTTRAKRLRRATGPSIERILYSFFSRYFRTTSTSALLSLERRLPISSSSRPSLSATSRNTRDQSSSQKIQRRKTTRSGWISRETLATAARQTRPRR